MTKKVYATQKYENRQRSPSSVNPFVEGLSTTIKVKSKGIGYLGKATPILNEDGGDTGLHSVVGVRKPVDREEFVKVFSGGLMAVLGLGKGPQDLFNTLLAIYISQKFGSEKIYINHAVAEEYGYTKKSQSFTLALNKLINNNFLREVKGQPNQYWVNPNMFFKGDRITLIQDFAVVGTSSGDALEKDIRDSDQGKLF